MRSIARLLFVSSVTMIASTMLGSALHAQEPTPSEVVSMRYLELKNREQFQFIVGGTQKYSKPVGDMNFDTPSGTPVGTGFEPTQRTFCVEPLVPIYSGRVYDFKVVPVNDPVSLGLPENEDGRVEANKRATFIRELYGRFYQDTIDNSQEAAPAFQAALWEIVGEKSLPEGPMPFNLFTGEFQANYPNEAESPAYVRAAQKYLQALTGDDQPFRDSDLLKDTEIIRLNGMPSAVDSFVPQAQLALRNASSVATAGNVDGGGGNGGFGLSSPGGVGPALGGGGGRGGAPFASSGLGALGGAPFVGGGGGGFGGGGGGGNNGGTPGNGNTNTPGGISPQLPGDNGTIILPPPIRPPQNIPPTIVDPPPSIVPPVDPPPPTPIDPLNPIVPAPPALFLLVGAAVFFGGKRLLKRHR